MSNILTCVYCGTAYPEGTPPAKAQILTDHIKVCPKHPMRKSEELIKMAKNLCLFFVEESKSGSAMLDRCQDFLNAVKEHEEVRKE